jgi:ATP-dependent phosphofructokinase / diphosphate-dependent phosphofructokinase
VKTLAILVDGGPAPGINAVIAAATIEARNHGVGVLGCYDGFRWLMQGDPHHVVELDIGDVTRAHFDGGSILRTSRNNPAGVAGGLERVADTLRRLAVDGLVTVGGSDAAYSASRLAEAAPGLRIAHVPKTIDNDLPLPSDVVTAGFTTACHIGKDLVRTLLTDAATTQRWFFVTVMGRRAGHLALGIGGAAAATLTVIAEEFGDRRITVEQLADVLEGAIIKRHAQGREHGVAVVSEALAAQLDGATPGVVERDAHGHVRLADQELARILKQQVAASLAARSLGITIAVKDIGYELRCAPPGAHDLQYARSLGYCAARFLLDGGTGAMISIQAGRLVPMPFPSLLDPATGRVRVRRVDVDSEMYRTMLAYMIRLKAEDFTPEHVGLLAESANLDEAAFVARFRGAAVAL